MGKGTEWKLSTQGHPPTFAKAACPEGPLGPVKMTGIPDSWKTNMSASAIHVPLIKTLSLSVALLMLLMLLLLPFCHFELLTLCSGGQHDSGWNSKQLAGDMSETTYTSRHYTSW
jgi:hypothetical protein